MFRVIETFSGIGSQAKALTRIGKPFEIVNTADWDINAILAYCLIHKGKIDINKYADISDEDMYAISLQEEPDGSLTDITSMDTDDTTLTSDYLSSNMQIEGNSDDSLAVDSTSVNHGVLSEGEDKADAADAIDDEVEVPGEAVFTSTTAVSNLDGARLLKEQTIAKNKATLLEIINNENLSEAAKQEAIDSMLTMTQTAQKETDAQMLLEAKGYADTVVSINNGTVDVMVNAVSLTDAQTAQIMDIVQRKTDVSAENIIITVSGTTP